MTSETPQSSAAKHGKDCPKVIHHGGGYLHDASADGPYDVDGVSYCGRCHGWMGSEPVQPSAAPALDVALVLDRLSIRIRKRDAAMGECVCISRTDSTRCEVCQWRQEEADLASLAKVAIENLSAEVARLRALQETEKELMDVHSLPFDTDSAEAELKAAGWIPDGYGTRWTDPDGVRWVGPAGAWRVLKRRQIEALQSDGSSPEHPRPDGSYGYPKGTPTMRERAEELETDFRIKWPNVIGIDRESLVGWFHTAMCMAASEIQPPASAPEDHTPFRPGELDAFLTAVDVVLKAREHESTDSLLTLLRQARTNLGRLRLTLQPFEDVSAAMAKEK